MSTHIHTSQSQDDYLEAILKITNENGFCRSIDLANHLGYATSSVSIAVGKLIKAALIRRGHAGELLLTEAGQHIAESVYEKHEFFSNWLSAIGVSKEIAEADACRIEHAISDTSFEKLKVHICQF
ncbi:MAG: metal-dependent transcriptional regulator [Lachnospiraceae bacterium]|nr:metal-dependent transcriptional regulator [Lachnospiraceae bacterium]